MKNNVDRIIMILAIIFLCEATTYAQDLKVFDLEFAKPLTVKECPYAVNEGQSGRGLFAKKLHSYAYLKLPSVKETCFKRVDNRFFDYALPRSTPLPVLTPPQSARIKIIFSDGSKPSLLAAERSNEIDAEVDENGNLIRVLFYTDMDKSKDILAVLLQKYGKYSSGKNYEAHTGYGSIREFSIFLWELKQLKVDYQTLINGTTILSTWGTVEITYQTKKIAPKDKNPL